MTTIELSRRNAHRVKSVQSKTNPENGVLPFNYYGTTANGHRCHCVGEGDTAEIIQISEMNQWEVMEFAHEPLLDEFWDAAHSAYYWNSFNPDRRQEATIANHEEELVNDLATMPQEEKERYTSNYKKYFGATLAALSRCANSAVTGPAKFNFKKNDAANNRYDATCREFAEWRQKALKAIAKHIEDSKPEEQKQDEAWRSLKNRITRSAETIISIDNGARGMSRALFVSNLYNKVETVANHGDVAIIEKAIAYIREINATAKKPIFTERHKFFKLLEVAQAVNKKEETNANRENKEVPFTGGMVVFNYAEDRLQILFDSKPDEAMRNRLKREGGMRWSPRNMAWQRQLTPNAVYAVKHYLKLEDCNL